MKKSYPVLFAIAVGLAGVSWLLGFMAPMPPSLPYTLRFKLSILYQFIESLWPLCAAAGIANWFGNKSKNQEPWTPFPDLLTFAGVTIPAAFALNALLARDVSEAEEMISWLKVSGLLFVHACFLHGRTTDLEEPSEMSDDSFSPRPPRGGSIH